MRILLAEDEPAVRKALSHLLTAWGHEVTEASTAREAIEALRQRPQVAIVDINLPDATGWDVLAATVRESGAPVRSIVISAVQPNGGRLRQFRPFGVLTKPFPIDSLARLVELARTEIAGDVAPPVAE